MILTCMHVCISIFVYDYAVESPSLPAIISGERDGIEIFDLVNLMKSKINVGLYHKSQILNLEYK